jgi:phosphate transport system substrate-binding protein
MTFTTPTLTCTRSVRALLWAGLAFTPMTVQAQDIALKSLDGRVNLFGQLVEFSGDHYVIRSSMGDLNVAAQDMLCEGLACPVFSAIPVDLNIAGSDTIGKELMPLLISGLAEAKGAAVKKQPMDDSMMELDVIGQEGTGDELFKAIVEFKGSGTAFNALATGAAEIGMASRSVKPEEAALFADRGLGDLLDISQEHAFAVDGLLVVTHPDNPVDALAMDDIAGLLSGRITNWSEVGGPDMPVNVYSRDANSGTFSTINEVILKPSGEALSPAAIILDQNEAISQSVYEDPSAIGYLGFAFKGDTKPVQIVSACGLISEPSAFSAKTGEYPLNRKLYLYNTNQKLSPQAAELVSFAESSAAYPFIEKAGFLSYFPERMEQSARADLIRDEIKTNKSRAEVALLRELFIDLTEFDRLSTTFRFKTGSASLDNDSMRDLNRLIDFIRANPDIEELSFVGFTDSDGPFEANRDLGHDRAEALEDIVYDELGIEDHDDGFITVRSFGELSPIDCNTEISGQKNNRRVEVWIKQ